MKLHQSTKYCFTLIITIMKKNFSQIATQVERIYSLYLKGYGTKRMLEKAESYLFGIQNVGLCF